MRNYIKLKVSINICVLEDTVDILDIVERQTFYIGWNSFPS